jgi:hypothetical protein
MTNFPPLIPPFIGFIGNQGSGKDHCCDYLARSFSYIKMGFSDPLYVQLAILNPIIKHPLEGVDRYERYNDLVEHYGVDWVKRYSAEVRSYLQRLGEEAGRQIHGRDCWVKYLDKQASSLPLVAIRDTRYENEIDYIRSRGGIIIWVQSDFAPERDVNHQSERLDYSRHADYAVQNWKSNPNYVHLRLLDVLEDYVGSTH